MDELQGSSVVRGYSYGSERLSERQLLGGERKTSYYGYDGHGSVRLLIDQSGAVTDTYTYDAFGNLINGAGATPNEYLYSGERLDANTGFYYLRARYMNPQSGRFWSMDSFEGGATDPRSLHKYTYASANPLTNIDPSGNFSIGEVSVSMGVATTLAAMSTLSLNLITAGTALSNAQSANYSLDGVLVSGRLNVSGFGGTVGAGVDIVYDFKTSQVWVALASEFGIAPLSIFKTQRGTGGSIMAGFVVGMHNPSELSGRGVGAAQPLALWRLQTEMFFGAGENKAWSLLMHLAKRSNNSIGWSGLTGVSTSGPSYFQIGKTVAFSSTVTENGQFVPLSQVPENIREYASGLGQLASGLAGLGRDAVSLTNNADSVLSQIQGAGN